MISGTLIAFTFGIFFNELFIAVEYNTYEYLRFDNMRFESTALIPETITMLLLGTGLIGLAAHEGR